MRFLLIVGHRLLPVAVVVATTLGMRQWLPPWLAVATTTVIGAALAVVGALVLRSTGVGEVSWRNRLAGHLLPFGHRFARGTLPSIVIACTAVWAALSAAALLATSAWSHPQGPTAPGAAPAASAPLWLWTTWLVHGAGLLYLIGLLQKHYSPGSQVTRSQFRVIGLVVAILLGSITLHVCGCSGLALLLGGGPVLLVGGGFALFLLTILTLGRRCRWN